MDWRTSSYSGANGGACVETATGNGLILVRDTTDRDGAMITASGAAWERFTASIRQTA